MAITRNNGIPVLALVGLAVVCGLSVANVYFNQALLPLLATALQVGTGEVSWIATASQLGYALGMLLIVPLGDRLDPRRLCQALLVWTAVMLGLASITSNWQAGDAECASVHGHLHSTGDVALCRWAVLRPAS